MKYITSLLIIIALIASFGPSVDLDYHIEPIELPPDLEKYIAHQESLIPGIRPGTEKKIVWTNSQHSQADLAIVYLHGFSASRQEVAPLCDLLARSLQANLYYPRLTGHGLEGSEMQDITVDSLINDAAEAIEIGKQLGRRVLIVASSTGASLATLLASQDNSRRTILGLVLLSPNFGLKRSESELLLLPWGNSIVKLVEGQTYEFTPSSTLQAKYWTTQYPSIALLPMMGLVKLAREAPLENIQFPVLVMYSPKDQVTDTSITTRQFARFSSANSQIQVFTHSGDPQQHILAGDALSPASTEAVLRIILSFVKTITAP